MYAQDNNTLPVWIILSPAYHHISTNSQPFLVGIVSDDHELTGLDDLTVAAFIDTQERPVIGIFDECAHLGKARSIHAAG